jgi:choline dehydrogenase-like flavoprotein
VYELSKIVCCDAGLGQLELVYVLCSTAFAFLRPAMEAGGTRLTVSTNTLVHRVVFSGRRAIGIEYQTDGKGSPLKRAYAKREVILNINSEKRVNKRNASI